MLPLNPHKALQRRFGLVWALFHEGLFLWGLMDVLTRLSGINWPA
jgi:hypothetical protein